MQSSIIFIGLACTMGVLTTPVTSRVPKALQYRGPEDRDVLIDNNAIPPEISEYFNSFFSSLTPNKLGTLLKTNGWADEVSVEFQADPDVETRTRSYQELYNDFLDSRKRRF